MADRENSNNRIEIANELSIMDFVYQNNYEVLYEDKNIAIVVDHDEEGELTIFKESNSWRKDDDTYGNTIRFVARMQGWSWSDATDFLVINRETYQTSADYNSNYEEHLNAENNTEESVKDNYFSDMKDMKPVSIEKSVITIGSNNVVHNGTKRSSKEETNRETKKEGSQKNSSEEQNDKSVITIGSNNVVHNGVKRSRHEETNRETKKEGSQKNSSEEQNDTQAYSRTKHNMDKQSNKDSSKEDIRKYSSDQLKELFIGLKRGLDVSKYDNIDLNPAQMKELRIAQQHGVDMKGFDTPNINADYMRQVCYAKESGIDISLFQLNEDGSCRFTPDQLREIRIGLQNGLSIEKVKLYANESLDANVMKALRLGIQDGIEQVAYMNNGRYTADDINNVRVKLLISKMLNSIKVFASDVFNSLVDLYKNGFTYQNANNSNSNDFSAETNYKKAEEQLNELTKEVYDKLKDKLENVPLEEKERILEEELRRILHIAKQQEQTSNINQGEELRQAFDTRLNELDELELKDAAMNSLENDYLERFYNNEEAYINEIQKIIDSLIKDPTITYEQKILIIHKTLGETFGMNVAQNWIKHIPIANENSTHLNHEQIRTIIEEYDKFTAEEYKQIEEEFSLERGQ